MDLSCPGCSHELLPREHPPPVEELLAGELVEFTCQREWCRVDEVSVLLDADGGDA